MSLLQSDSRATSAMNIILEHSISTVSPDGVMKWVSVGIVWGFQLCLEREDIAAMSRSLAKAFYFFPIVHKDRWQKRKEYRETWISGF